MSLLPILGYRFVFIYFWIPLWPQVVKAIDAWGPAIKHFSTFFWFFDTPYSLPTEVFILLIGEYQWNLNPFWLPPNKVSTSFMDAPMQRAQKMADNCLCCHIGYISNSSKGIFETIVDKIQGREEISLTPYPTQCGQNFSNL